jgi:hypothetical protein
MIVHIVAHVLDKCGNKMCPHGLVFASLNRNPSRAIIPGIGTDSRECFALEAEDQRRP